MGGCSGLTSGMTSGSKNVFLVYSEAFGRVSRPERVARVRLRLLTGPIVEVS